MSQQYIGDLNTGTLEPTGNKSERPVRELLVELWENTETLVRQELKLASAEIDEKVSQAKADLTKAAIGGAMLYVGVLALTTAIILFLAKFVAPWVAALLVAVVMVGVGYMLVQKGKDLNAKSLTPERTIRSVREDVHAFREATK
jgi:hypothetical protein